MRDLETIDRELAQAREELSHVDGTPAEVYSRIVGYYRSVRNWNRGKREEYGERRMFNPALQQTEKAAPKDAALSEKKVLLFVRKTCPACPQAKAEASKLGLPVETLDAGTETGLAEAKRLGVLATPTAILLSGDGRELARARTGGEIASLALAA